MRKRLARALPLLVAVVCAASNTIKAQTGTLAADTAVTSSHAATNYGTLSNLYVSASSTALLRFDLGTLPANATASQVSRATLRVFVNRVNTPGILTVSPVNAAWAEAAVTAQTLPTTGNAVEVFAVTDEGQFLTVDVTSLVQSWISSPARNFGFALTASTADVVLDSKENDTTAHPAQLEIALTSAAAGTAGPQGPKGDKGDTGLPGIAGSPGPQGPKGDRGDAGPAGSSGAGMSYRGPWAAQTAYTANDVVTYDGAAWISLSSSNTGRTPGAAPGTWSVLVPAAIDTGTTTVINGLLFDGAYATATNYPTNHVVIWQNAAFVSLHDSNHGNTPGDSLADWATLVPAAIGLTGAQGPKGDTGNTGPQGERGFTGASGPQGERGATGATGRPGFVYQGSYASTTNYAAGDVVLWQGGSWASLAESNHGNTPGESPTFWGPLTTRGLTGEAGSMGPQGPAGAQGPAGMVGSPGETGPTGPVGSTGPQGSPGRDGAQGLPGERGSVGPQGDPGPAGLSWQGAYAFTTNYTANDAVSWRGQSWLSLHTANHGNTPDTSPADWVLLAAAGSAGPQGDAGPPGPQGGQGIAGPQGPKGDPGGAGATGLQGPPGMQYAGVFNSATGYAARDVITYGGGAWLSLQPENHGNIPGISPAWWQQIAAPGEQGSTGPQGARGEIGPTGPTGEQGPAGIAGPQGPPVHFLGAWSAPANYLPGDSVFYNGSAYIATGTVTGNPPGISPLWALLAQQGSTGAAGPQGPQGQAGATGAAGAQGTTGATGPAGLRWRGAYDHSTGYITGDAVAFNGASYISTSDLNNGNIPDSTPQWSLLAAAGQTGTSGTNGSNGARGNDGVAATIHIDAVSTGEPGSAAAVENTGTANAAMLHFTLPRGATGPAGSPGLTFRGAWTSGTGYTKDDVVFRSGSSYVSRSNNNTADPVVSVTTATGDWELLASQGNPGPASVAIGSVSTGASAVVTNTGTANAAVLNFTLPRGEAGAAGPAGLTYLGAWDTEVHYQPTQAVSYTGSSYIARAASTGIHPTGDPGSDAAWLLLAAQGSAGPAGPGGPTGATGAAGITPTITIGATHTAAPGTDAAVTNVGTATAVQLEFTIPRGAAGGGTAGGGVYSTVHTVPAASMGAQVYSPLADTRAPSSASSVLGYLPATCNISSVTVYNVAPVDITFNINTGVPGSMVPAVSPCTAKTATATACPGPGLLRDSNFMTFGVTTTYSATSYIYTQFSCS